MKYKTLCAVAATLLLSAFTNPASPEKDIIGRWKFDDATVTNTVNRFIGKLKLTNPAIADKFESQRGRVKAQIEAIRITFNADHTGAVQSGDKNTTSTWALTDNNRILQTTTAEGTIRRDSILQLTPTRLQTVNVKLRDTVLYIRP